VSLTYSTPAGDVAALASVTQEFVAGESVAVVGRSGSGKSSLISVMALLRRPTSGQVIVADTDAQAASERQRARLRRSIGTVFQSFHVDDRLSVRDNVMFPYLFNKTLSRRQACHRADRLIERLGLDRESNRRASDISGGQRQRVAIARALLGEPAVLIADEPTGSLDEQTADQVAQDLFALARELQTAVVVVTHDERIAAMADMKLLMSSGSLSVVNCELVTLLGQ